MKVSIHRALSEIKLIDKKLESKIQQFVPVGTIQHDKKVDNIYTTEEFETLVKGNYQSIQDLIDRKVKIKNAINLANSTTMVKVSGKEMTITEAINMKTTIEVKKDLLRTITSRYKTTVSKMVKHNDKVEIDADASAKTLLGSDKKSSADEVKSIMETYRKTRVMELVNPIKCEDEMKSLFDEITDFEAEVDTILSEANAITQIEI